MTRVLLWLLVGLHWIDLPGKKPYTSKLAHRAYLVWISGWMLALAIPVLLLESVLSTIALILERPMRIVLWIAAGLVTCVPTAIVWYDPSQYTPFVSVVLSVCLFVLSVWASRTDAAATATKAANARWLPQAESACDRLMTVSHTAQKHCRHLQVACGRAEAKLPELGAEKAQAVRVFIESQCREGANTLSDIANHLDSAYAAW
jgi:hypothetical protein